MDRMAKSPFGSIWEVSMEEKKPSDAGSLDEMPEKVNQEDRMDSEFSHFEELISSEENVEYEEDSAIQTLHNAEHLKDRHGKSSHRLNITSHTKEAGQSISIPLYIEMSDDVTEEYTLNIAVSLQKAKQKANPYPGYMGPDLNPDDHSELEIDILDGRTTTLYEEEEEIEEVEKERSDESTQGSWLSKIFFWKHQA
jgi:hypothetical protein